MVSLFFSNLFQVKVSHFFGLLASSAKRGFIRNMAVMMTGTAIGQVVTLISTPFLSRLYDPSMFGTFSVYSSVIIMISMISTLRYDHALMLAKDDSDAIALFYLSVISVVVFACISFMGSLLYHEFADVSQTYIETALWIFVLPVWVFAVGLYQCIVGLVSRKKLFTLAAKSHAYRAVTAALVKILFGIKHPHSLGLMYGQISGEIVSNLNVAYRVIVKDRLLLNSPINFKRMKSLAVEYKDFAFYGSGQLLIGAAALQVPILLMAFYYDKQSVGYYSFAISMIQFPLLMLQNSLRQVFFQKACETFHCKGDLLNLLKKTIISLYALFLLPSLVILFFGPDIFTLIFGEKWRTAGIFAQCLIPASFIAFPKVPVNVFTRIYRKQRQVLILESFILTLQVLVYWQFGELIPIINMVIINSVIVSLYNICLISWVFYFTKNERHDIKLDGALDNK